MTFTTPTLDDPCCELGHCVWCDNAGDGGALGSVVVAEGTPRARAISNMADPSTHRRHAVRYVLVHDPRRSWFKWSVCVMGGRHDGVQVFESTSELEARAELRRLEDLESSRSSPTPDAAPSTGGEGS